MVSDYITARVRVKAPAVLLGLFVVFAMAISWAAPAQAASTSSYLNFQARLMGSNGTVVADGTYNIDFKIYNADSTTGTVGTCNTSCLWEETRKNSNSQGVQVINGFFSVNLGSVTAFPTTINWDQQLYLTMNIGGTTTGASPTWDGEMQNAGHSIALTALPYSFVAGQLAKTNGANRGTLAFNTVANNPNILLPDASGTVCLQAASACGFESTTGTDFIQNQNSIVQTANFNINGTGVLGTSLITPLLLTTDQSLANSADITLRSGNQTGSALSSGNVTIKSGDAGGGTNSNSGNVTIDVGSKSGSGTTGTVSIGGSNASGLTLGNITTTTTASLDGSTINIGNSSPAHVINIGHGGSNAQTINIGSTSSSSAVAITAGSGGISLGANTTVSSNQSFTANGSALFQDATNSSTAFQIQNSIGSAAIIANTTPLNSGLTNPSFEGTDVSAWPYIGTPGSVARDTTQSYIGSASLKIATSGSDNNGVKFVTGNGAQALAISSTYALSFYAKLDASSAAFTTLHVHYARNGSTEANCSNISTTTVVTTGWTRVTCNIVTDGTTPASTAYFAIEQGGTTAHTWYIDGVQIELASSASPFQETSINLNGVVTSPVAFRNSVNSTTAFQIQDSTGSSNLFIADTQQAAIGIGGAPVSSNPLQVFNSSQSVAIGSTPGGGIGISFNNINSNKNTFIHLLGSSSGGLGFCASTTTTACSSGQDQVQLAAGGAATFRNGSDTGSGFQIQNASGTNIFNVDTSNALVGTLATNVASTNSQDFNLRTGNAAGATSNSGSLKLDVGTATGTAGSILLGTVNNAAAITIGSTTQTGTITIGQSTATNTITIGNAAGNSNTQTINIGNSSTSGSTTTITLGSTTAASTTTINGGNGITLANNTLASGNVDVAGSVATKKGTDFATTGTTTNASFSNASLIRLTGASAQTIDGIANGRDGYRLTIVNAANQAATIVDKSNSLATAANQVVTGTGGNYTLASGASIQLIYDAGASVWRQVSALAAITTIGTYSSSNHYANGATISGNSLILGSADSSNPGLVDTSNQTFSGNKTFTGTLTVAPTTNIGSVVIKQTSAASPTNDIFDVQGTNGTSNFIQITSTAANQGAVNISSFGSNNITLQAGSGTVSLGSSTNLNATGALTVASGGTSDLTLDSLSSTLKFGTNTSNILFTNSGTALIDAASTKTLALGTSNNAHQTTLGSTNASATTTVQGGGGVTLNGNTNVSSGKTFTVTDGATSVTNSTGTALTVNNSSGANSIAVFQDNGTPVATIADNGASTFENSANSTTAFQIQNNGASDLLNVNTTDGYVINNGTTNLGNIIQNPGFESSGSGDGTGWFTPGTGQAITNDAANAHSGNYTLEITGNSSTHAVTTKYYAVKPGDTVYFEAYVKNSAGANGDGGIYIEFSDKDKANATFTTMDTGLPGTSYILKSNTLTIPANKYYIRLAASVRATSTTGTFYFDDFYLKKVNESASLLLTGVSTTAFQVQNSSSQTVLGVDSSNSRIFTGIPDSAGAIGFLFNTPSYTTSGAKLFSLQNNLAEKFYVDKDGNLNASGTITSGSTITSGAGISATGDITTSAGNISAGSGKQFQINGTQISSAALSNNSDIAKLSGTGPQVFSGNNKFTGTVLVQNANSAGFQVQNATANVMTVDTSGNTVILGTAGASGVTGKVQYNFSGSTGSISITALDPSSTAYTLSLPAETGTFCTSASTSTGNCTNFASATGLTSGLNGKLNKNSVDTSAASVTAVQGNLYAFTNNSNNIASGILKLDNGNNTGNVLTVTGTFNYGAGNAYIVVNNTNATPSGFLIDLQANGTTKFNVDASGNVAAAGNISIASGKQYQINGTQISTSALSDGNTLAHLGSNQTFSGNNTFSSASNSFTGDGSGLTNLNATNIASGTLNDGRLSSNVALLNRTGQSFTGDNTFAPTNNNAGTTIRQTSGTATSGSVLDVQTADGLSHFFQVTNTAANQGAVTLQSVGASNALTLGSASGTLSITAATNTIQHNNSSLTIDVNNGSTSTLNILNSQAGIVANLSVEGNIAVGSGQVYQVGATNGTGITCSSNTFLQNGTTLGGIVTGGSCASAVTTVGAPTTGQANGASITGNTLNLNTADVSNPGIVSTSAQSFNGAKTFTAGLIANSNGTSAFQVQNTGNVNFMVVDTTNNIVNIGITGSTNATATVNIGNSTVAAETTSVGSSFGSSTTTINGGTGGINLTPNGSSNTGVLVKPTNNSTAAFSVQPSGSTTPVFDVDTTNTRVGINTASPGAALSINSGTSGTSGLQFTQLNSNSAASSSFSQLLGLDTSGNVGLSSAGLSLTSPALAYWDGLNTPVSGSQSYPTPTLSGSGTGATGSCTGTWAPTFVSGSGVELNPACANTNGSMNWNFSQVAFEENQFQFKAGTGAADATWFYGYTDSVPTTEYGCNVAVASCNGTTGPFITNGYLVYFSEFHNCVGISYGGYKDGNQCNNGGGTSNTGTSPLKSVSTASAGITINDNAFHQVDIQILYNVITVRWDGKVILTYTDSYGRDVSHLNYGFAARSGGSTNTHFIKGLLVTKLGTNVSEYNILDIAPLTNNITTTTNNMYWENSSGSLGIDTVNPNYQLDVTGTGHVSGNFTSGNGATGETGGSLVILDSDTNATFRGGTSTNAPTEVDGGMFYDSTDNAFMCGNQGIWTKCTGMIASNTAASTAIASCTTACASFDNGRFQIPANFMQPGKTIHLIARGVFSTTGTPTFGAWGVYFGSNATTKTSDTAFGGASGPTPTSAALGTVSNVQWQVDYIITCYTTGSSGTVSGNGTFTFVQSATTTQTETTLPMASSGTTTMNTTTAQTIYLFPAWGTSSASNTVTAQNFYLKSE